MRTLLTLPRGHEKGHNPKKGFTVIELLVALTVMSILMGVAVPSLREWTEDARVKGVASDLASDIYVTRSTALKVRCDVAMAPVGGNWANGWTISYMATSATDATCAASGGATLTVKTNAGDNSLTVTGPAAGFSFGSDGRLTGTAPSMTIYPARAGSTVKMRCLGIGVSGRPNTKIDADYNRGNGC